MLILQHNPDTAGAVEENMVFIIIYFFKGLNGAAPFYFGSIHIN